MRFLIDENLSPRLVVALSDTFPDSTHVETLQLRGCDNARVWAAARDGVVHLRVGNADTAAVVALLRERRADVEAFAQDDVTSLLVLP